MSPLLVVSSDTVLAPALRLDSGELFQSPCVLTSRDVWNWRIMRPLPLIECGAMWAVFVGSL